MFWGFITRDDLAATENSIVNRVASRFSVLMSNMERRLMAKLDDQLSTVTNFLTSISADVGTLNTEVQKIGNDTQSLLDEIANMPRGGLTPEQQAALDNITNLAQGVSDAIKPVVEQAQALDDKVPDPQAKPAEVVAAANDAAKADGGTGDQSGGDGANKQS